MNHIQPPMHMRWGDGVMAIAMLIWISHSVGPSWIGIAIFVIAYILNVAEGLLFRARVRRMDNFLKQAAAEISKKSTKGGDN